MSKVDAQRAMREAKYARTQASGVSRRAATPAETQPLTPAAGAPQPKHKPASEAAAAATGPSAAALEGERCGHRSMNGRVCTREAAHAEKSHRYG
jgi:hypothetical protein